MEEVISPHSSRLSQRGLTRSRHRFLGPPPSRLDVNYNLPHVCISLAGLRCGSRLSQSDGVCASDLTFTATLPPGHAPSRDMVINLRNPRPPDLLSLSQVRILVIASDALDINSDHSKRTRPDLNRPARISAPSPLRKAPGFPPSSVHPPSTESSNIH